MWKGRQVKACFGTTKYCNAFLKGVPCNNHDCLYLHELGAWGAVLCWGWWGVARHAGVAAASKHAAVQACPCAAADDCLRAAQQTDSVLGDPLLVRYPHPS